MVDKALVGEQKKAVEFVAKDLTIAQATNIVRRPI